MTQQYPFEKQPAPDRLRGKLTWESREVHRLLPVHQGLPVQRHRADRDRQEGQALRDALSRRPLHLLRAVRAELPLRMPEHVE